MNKILVTVSILAIVAMIITVLAVLRPVKVELPESQFGGTSYDIYHPLKVHGAFNWGGKVFATTTASTAETLAGSDLATYDYIDVMSTTGALTYTLPATSTMISLLPDVGSTRKWLFHNATSSSGITLTLAAGAGMDLVAASTTVATIVDVLNPTEWAELTCTQIYYRSADNQNIMCIITRLLDAD